MSHRAQQIVDAIATTLAASTTLGASVFKNRRFSVAELDQELPAVSVNYGADAPLSEFGVTNVAFVDSLLEVKVIIALRADSEDEVLTALLDRRVAQHVALMADRSLGLSFVMDTRYGGADAPEIDVSLDRPAGAIACRWFVHYRSNLSDPS